MYLGDRADARSTLNASYRWSLFSQTPVWLQCAVSSGGNKDKGANTDNENDDDGDGGGEGDGCGDDVGDGKRKEGGEG